jgi:superfamily II DNA/RNA helicase
MLVLVLGWLQEVPDFTLASVQMVVYDEADRLFEMGFAEQLGAIMKVHTHTRSMIA